MSYKSEDVKKMNCVCLLNELTKLSNATMDELIEKTHFSRSLVRSILKYLESKDILIVKNIDQSSGGRCPSRYTFNKCFFNILSIFIGEGIIDFVVKDIFNHVTFQNHVNCELDIRLEMMIIDITKKYHINCICIGSSGVVQDDCFYNDHGEYMEKHDIALKLKQQLDIPIVIENDVKSMMMGIQANNQYDSLAYLYMNQTGIGSAYYFNQQILKGNQSFSGELGLLPYQLQSINEMIASQPSIEILEDIWVQLLVTVAVTIDPRQIIISGNYINSLSLSKIKSKMQKYLSLRYEINIEISHNSINDGLNGLHYIGILKLFDIYTDYERKKRNG